MVAVSVPVALQVRYRSLITAAAAAAATAIKRGCVQLVNHRYDVEALVHRLSVRRKHAFCRRTALIIIIIIRNTASPPLPVSPIAGLSRRT